MNPMKAYRPIKVEVAGMFCNLSTKRSVFFIPKS